MVRRHQPVHINSARQERGVKIDVYGNVTLDYYARSDNPHNGIIRRDASLRRPQVVSLIAAIGSDVSRGALRRCECSRQTRIKRNVAYLLCIPRSVRRCKSLIMQAEVRTLMQVTFSCVGGPRCCRLIILSHPCAEIAVDIPQVRLSFSHVRRHEPETT